MITGLCALPLTPIAGCDAWYTAFGGTLPAPIRGLSGAARAEVIDVVERPELR